jgi:hypothetical protein
MIYLISGMKIATIAIANSLLELVFLIHTLNDSLWTDILGENAGTTYKIEKFLTEPPKNFTLEDIQKLVSPTFLIRLFEVDLNIPFNTEGVESIMAKKLEQILPKIQKESTKDERKALKSKLVDLREKQRELRDQLKVLQPVKPTKVKNPAMNTEKKRGRPAETKGTKKRGRPPGVKNKK